MTNRRFLVTVALLAALSALDISSPARALPVAWVVAAFSSIGVALGTAATVVTFVVNAVLIMGANLLLRALNKPTIPGQQRQASVVTLSLGESPRAALFGRVEIAGTLADAFDYGGANGTDWEVQVIVLADHLCDALEGVWINDNYMGFAGDGVVAGYNSQLEIYFLQGTSAQTLPSFVTAHSDWLSADNLAGLCAVVVQYKADAANASAPVWSGSRPSFLWRLRGARLYDPRLDSTVGGSGSHRWATPSTWAWSENAALARYNWSRGIYACGRQDQPDQLLIGRGLSVYEAPPGRVFAAANLCDEMVSLTGGGSEPRYRVGGAVFSNQSYIEVEQLFADAMAGDIVQPFGGVEVAPGAAQDPAFDLTDDDLVVGAAVEYAPFLSDTDRINTVVPQYLELTLKSQMTAAAVQQLDSTHLIADGGPRSKTLSLSLVNYRTQAQRLAAIYLAKARLEAQAKIVLPPRFAGLEEGDWLTWTSARYTGGATVTLRVTAFGLDAAWRNSLTLQQISAGVYDGALSESTVSPPPWPTSAPSALALSGFAAVAVLTTATDGSTVPAINVSWSAPVDPAITAIRFDVRKHGGTAVTSTSTTSVNSGALTVYGGVLSGTSMDIMATPIAAPGRAVSPTSWITVSTTSATSYAVTTFDGHSPSYWTGIINGNTTDIGNQATEISNLNGAIVLKSGTGNRIAGIVLAGGGTLPGGGTSSNIVLEATNVGITDGTTDYFPFSVSGGAVHAHALFVDSIVSNTIQTAHIQNAQITDPFSASSSSTFTGDGTWQTLLTDTITMAAAGTIYVNGSAKQSFSAQPVAWDFALQIDGSTLSGGAPGGTVPGDSQSFTGSASVGSGSHTVRLLWNGATSDVAVVDCAFNGLRAYK